MSSRSYLANFVQILQILWIPLNSKLVFFAKYGVHRKTLTGLGRKKKRLKHEVWRMMELAWIERRRNQMKLRRGLE